MKLVVNGEARSVEGPLSLAGLLDEMEYNTAAVACALNREFVPRGAYDTTQLKDGDEVEIVAPLQGG